MADTTSPSAQNLFTQWRGGDAEAGQLMAQRFSDWYYAVTAARLGDQNGRGPLQRACTRFQQGITGVAEPRDLADWAHRIVAEEITMAGGRIVGGDFPNLLTGGKSPTEILRVARAHLSPDQVKLISHAYDSSFPIDQVTRECEAIGGYPYAVLHARYELKRALRDHEGIAFTEVPTEPNLDNGPLPLYEAGRMANPAEEAGFEKYLLTNMALCKDIAEFGVFALALRAGAFAGSAVISPSPAATAPARTARSSSPTDDPFADPAESGMNSGVFVAILIGAFLLLGLMLLAGLAVWRFIG